MVELVPPKGIDLSGLIAVADKLRGKVAAVVVPDMTAAVMSRIETRRTAVPWWQRLWRPVVAVPVGAAAVCLALLTLWPLHTPPIPPGGVASALDREIPMAQDYAVFRSEQAFAGGEGILFFAELTAEAGDTTSQ